MPGLALNVSCVGLVPDMGATASQLPPLSVTTETENGPGMSALVTLKGWLSQIPGTENSAYALVAVLNGASVTVSATAMTVGVTSGRIRLAAGVMVMVPR